MNWLKAHGSSRCRWSSGGCEMMKKIMTGLLVLLLLLISIACGPPAQEELAPPNQIPPSQGTDTPAPALPIPALTNKQPIEVVSVMAPYELPNPGGPPLQITLRNVSVEPVTSLNVTFVSGREFDFDFHVTSVNPLMPGDTTTVKRYLIGGGYSRDISYPLKLSGTLQNGMSFSYTKQVQVTIQPWTDEEPIEIISVVGPVPPFNPGTRDIPEGWTAEITLKNAFDETVISLSVILAITATGIIYTSDFAFDINSSNPLLPGKTISSKGILYSTSGDVSYSLYITGNLENGTAFGYMKPVQLRAAARQA